MAEFSLPIRVYIEDTDAGGIVYYINYLKFMERARTELMRALGFGKKYIFNVDNMFVVHSSQINYILPAQLDDELEVVTTILNVRAVSILFEQTVKREGVVLCRAEIKVACVSRESLKPTPLPEEVMLALKESMV